MAQQECERCNAGGNESYQDSDPRCGEIQLAYGFIAWLCFSCRREWIRKQRLHEATARFSEASLRLEHWKAQVSATGKADIEDGLRLYKNLDMIEREMLHLAEQFMETGNGTD